MNHCIANEKTVGKTVITCKGDTVEVLERDDGMREAFEALVPFGK